MEKPKYSISPEAIANGINDLLDEKEELQERIDNALCILNELYDCDIKEEDYNLIHLAIKTLRGSDSNE